MAKNILIIEDDDFFGGLISKKIADEGFDVSIATDGKKGLEQVKKIKPDLVLLDLLLPNMDGYEVLSEVKKDQAVSSIPVIILSNLNQKEDVEKGMKLGASDFLMKFQFTPEEVVAKIKKALGV